MTKEGRRPGWLPGCLLIVALGCAPAVGQDLPPAASLAGAEAIVAPPSEGTISLAELESIALNRNPELRQAGHAVEVASGRAVQAGLYPNPEVTIEGSELGNPQAPGGTVKAPVFRQEIVLGGKLSAGRQAAQCEASKARALFTAKRFELLTSVRKGYFDMLAAQQRVEVLAELTRLSGETQKTTETLVKGGQAAPLDLVQIRVEKGRFEADLEAARQQRTAAWRRLAAVIGVPEMAERPVAGSLDALWPNYEFDEVVRQLGEIHPEIRASRVELNKAQWELKRATAEVVPNVTVGAGYERDNIAKEDYWTLQASMPLPIFNRNQGNRQAAAAEVHRAGAGIDSVRNALVARAATAFGQYDAARRRAVRYRDSILPDADQAYRLALAAFQGGQFEYLRVLQAQRAVAESRLEYLRALHELWSATCDIAGLLLEEHWPPGG